MKHLLIILSILLPCTAIGDNHKEGTLYKWFTSSGIVWKGIGDKNIHHVYKGDVVNGVPNGVGILTSPNGSKYIGEFKDGLPNGQGTDIFPDGSKGIGEFREGRPWNITHRDKNGNIIVKFVNGKEIKP